MSVPTSGTSASGRKIISEEAWKAQAKKNAVEPDIMLVKEGFVAKADDATKPITFILSTEDVDRAWGGGDIIRQDGWDLKNYIKNPVVLWSHDSFTPAIGRSRVWVDGKKLMGEVVFAREQSELAREVEDLIRGDFVRACSVGFNPKKWQFDETRGEWAADYLEQELLEWSPCNIPCNPNALVAAKSAGLDLKASGRWAEEMLAKLHGPGMFVSRDLLEKSALAIGGRKIIDLGAAKRLVQGRKDAGDDETPEGTDEPVEPEVVCEKDCCKAATLVTNDRVKVGDKLGTVKATGVGHYCDIEFDDGTKAMKPAADCTKTDEPKPAENDKQFTMEDLRKTLETLVAP